GGLGGWGVGGGLASCMSASSQQAIEMLDSLASIFIRGKFSNKPEKKESASSPFWLFANFTN
ncbi:MAG: hypothetical protein DWQ58_00250, partial [Microcystis aeruginosa TA09]